eukprot:gene27142-2375_t
MHRILLAAYLLVSLLSLSLSEASLEPQHQRQRAHKMADGCRHVYIDMGTNVGHQIRKVYQPEIYTQMFTGVAVGIKEGNITFMKDHQHASDVSARVIPEDSTGFEERVTLPSIDMAAFFRQEIIGRFIPESNQTLPPAIVMKSDIEHQDMKVQSHMLVHGVWCHITAIYGEHMTPEWMNSMRMIAEASENCPTVLLDLDDETDGHCLPLPGTNYSDPDEHPKPNEHCHGCLKQEPCSSEHLTELLEHDDETEGHCLPSPRTDYSDPDEHPKPNEHLPAAVPVVPAGGEAGESTGLQGGSRHSPSPVVPAAVPVVPAGGEAGESTGLQGGSRHSPSPVVPAAVPVVPAGGEAGESTGSQGASIHSPSPVVPAAVPIVAAGGEAVPAAVPVVAAGGEAGESTGLQGGSKHSPSPVVPAAVPVVPAGGEAGESTGSQGASIHSPSPVVPAVVPAGGEAGESTGSQGASEQSVKDLANATLNMTGLMRDDLSVPAKIGLRLLTYAALAQEDKLEMLASVAMEEGREGLNKEQILEAMDKQCKTRG